MTKEQMSFYENEFRITNYKIYSILDEAEDLHIFYRYDSQASIKAGQRMDRALKEGIIDEIFYAMNNLNSRGGYAPKEADVEAIDANGVYVVGKLLITEDTYLDINEWEDLSGNYDD